MRNPNGYGSITKLSGKRRNPYVARKTVGFDDRAYPIYAIIGYYPTRADAMMALASYNADPYNLDVARVTFKELYDLWSKEAYPKMSESLKTSCKAAYSHCSSVYKVPYRSIRKNQMQNCIDNCGKGYSTRTNIKLLFVKMDSYAFDHDIISKCYSSNLEVGEKEETRQHTVFEDKEVMELWKHAGDPYIDETLFLLYTGMRLSEMLQMKTENVHLDKGYMVGGMKTKAGKNRVVPIHPDLKPIIARHISDQEYLFQLAPNQDTHTFATAFSRKWVKELSKHGMDHLTHDCRHTVRSKLDSAGANKVAIDRIIGHSSQSVGEKVYTHKTIEELKEALNTLTYGNVSA